MIHNKKNVIVIVVAVLVTLVVVAIAVMFFMLGKRKNTAYDNFQRSKKYSFEDVLGI